MKDNQENLVTMFFVVQDLCEENDTIWNTDAPFTASYNLFTGQLSIITTQRAIQATDTSGAAVDKKNMRNTLMDQTFFVANRVHSYAAANNNQELLYMVNYTRTDLKKARDTQLIGIAKLVHDTAQTYVGSLSAFGITNSVLNALDAAITAFQAVVSKPRVSRTVPIAATKALDTAIKMANVILKTRMDIDVEVFKPTNLTFYNQYFAAREVIDLSPNKLALKVNVIDSNTSKPVGAVKAFVSDINLSKKTTELGNFQVNNMPDGVYTVTFTKNGYEPATRTAYINGGETTVLNVSMVPLPQSSSL